MTEMLQLLQARQQLVAFGIGLLLIWVLLHFVQLWLIQRGPLLWQHLLQAGSHLKHRLHQQRFCLYLKAHFPKGFQILSARLQRQHFYGLPLTFLLLVFIYLLALLSGLVEDVVTSDSIVMLDHWLSQRIHGLHEPVILLFFAVLTSFGSTLVCVVVLLLTSLVLGLIRQPYIIIGLLTSSLGGFLFTAWSKTLFQRVRPADALIFEPTYSFPSGHATVAVALYGFLAYLAIRFSRYYFRQVQIFLLSLEFIVLLGASRVMLNVHYLSDVLAGFLVGSLWLVVAISLTEWLTVIGKICWPVLQMHQLKMLHWSVCLATIVIVIYSIMFHYPHIF